ncbi:hypothetical protein EGI24_09870 [Lacihabitans sp. CS3-21]|nr:hypothetical protein [Lacihabitans sp. CS3-21]
MGLIIGKLIPINKKDFKICFFWYLAMVEIQNISIEFHISFLLAWSFKKMSIVYFLEFFL